MSMNIAASKINEFRSLTTRFFTHTVSPATTDVADLVPDSGLGQHRLFQSYTDAAGSFVEILQVAHASQSPKRGTRHGETARWILGRRGALLLLKQQHTRGIKRNLTNLNK